MVTPMKSLTKTLLITIVLSTLSFSAFGSDFEGMDKIVFDRTGIVFPVPSDSEVIKTIGQASRASLPARRMKFLVWNLHKGTEDTFKYEYLLLAMDRDIVMNQEVFLDVNMLDVFKFLPHFYFTTATSFFSGKENIPTGVASNSTVKPVATKFVRTQIKEPVVHSPKVALITSYPIAHSDRLLTVVNLHGINFVSDKSFTAELNRIYEAIKNIPSPLVFAGDFNTWNKDRIKILADYSKKLGLSEAKFVPDNRMTFNGFPLDHFLHTSDIKIVQARVDKFYQGSDHKPLQVEIEYLNPSISQLELDQNIQE
jgi:endonuclease/exonuclease/phosphatase (EEP) superfamily protein YafD